MSFALNMVGSCCCINLNKGTKIIGFSIAVTSSIISTLYAAPLFIVPYLETTKQLFYSSVAVTSAVHCVLTCLLLYSIYQKKPKFFWPWIIFSWMIAAVLIPLSTMGVIFVQLDMLFGNAEVIVIITLYMIYGVLLVYFGFVVKSRANEMAWDLMYLKQHTRYTELVNRPNDYYS